MQAILLAQKHGYLSIQMLQRRLGIGYVRSEKLINELTAQGIVGLPETIEDSREPIRMLLKS